MEGEEEREREVELGGDVDEGDWRLKIEAGDQDGGGESLL